MRVALVVGQFPALSETFILNHITGLLDRGVEVEIFATTQLPQAAVHPDVHRYALLDRTCYARPVADDDRRRRMEVLRLFGRALVRAPFQGRSLRELLRTGREDANSVLGFAHLASRSRERYDIIHCHFGSFGLTGMALRKLGVLGGKLVTTFHGYDMSRLLVEAGPHVYDRLFREGDLFLPISEFWRDKLVAMGCPPERTRVHRMGVRCDQFTFVPRAVGEEGPIHLLTVARLIEKKGVEYAIRAVARLLPDHPALRYAIVGDGPRRAELERLIGELGVGDAVHLLGPKTSEEVAELMARSQVLLAPSVTAADGNQEGIPVVLMEAMATGLPVISTYHTGIPELVEHEVTGLLVPERDVEALAAQLRRLLVDGDLYARLPTAARTRVEEEYDVERLNERLVTMYRELVARSAVSADPGGAASPQPGERAERTSSQLSGSI